MEAEDKGVAGEEFVNKLSYSSYLKFWCYPGPKDEKGDKKEIADLLILFKEVAIIISVKNYEFKGQYERYFRRTIEKAVSQVYGAERKLFQSRNPIYKKHPQRDVEQFLPDNYKSVIRLIVNLGDDVQFYPTGLITNSGKYIHVLDKKAFSSIVSELDTIPDLVHYFSNKELALNGKDIIMLPGEENAFDEETGKQYFKFIDEKFEPTERQSIMIMGNEQDLLAKYLENNRAFPSFFSEDYTNMMLELDGAWDSYIGREEVKLKKQHDHISYFVDELVKNEILIKNESSSIMLAKELLSFNRFERRIIGQSFFDMIKQYANKSGWHIGRRHGKIGDTLVSFAIYGKEMKQEAVDAFLELALKGYSLFEGYRTQKSILIAANNDMTQFKMGYIDNIVPFDSSYEKLLKEDLKKINWFQNPKMTPFSFKEYPETK